MCLPACWLASDAALLLVTTVCLSARRGRRYQLTAVTWRALRWVQNVTSGAWVDNNWTSAAAAAAAAGEWTPLTLPHFLSLARAFNCAV